MFYSTYFMETCFSDYLLLKSSVVNIHIKKSGKVCTQCPIQRTLEKVCYRCTSSRSTDKQDRTKDCGDYKFDKYERNGRKNKKVTHFSSGDLASGDHSKANNARKADEEIYNIDTKLNKEKSTKKIVETIVEYKNENYDDSKSSTDSSLCSIIKNSYLNTHYAEVDKNYEVQENMAILRPVFCPVLSCAKLVAIDSIMSHFYYDHSKIKRIPIGLAEPEEFYMKPSSMSTEAECIVIYLRQIGGRSSETSQNTKTDCRRFVNGLNNNNKLLLLMAVKIQASVMKLRKCDSAGRISKRNSYTQTNKTDFSYCNINQTYVKQCKREYKLNINQSKNYNSDDIILLWLCKFYDEEKTYTITMTREDQKLSYSYTGDAVHIREQQDPWSIYDRPECLIVRGKAINKLLNSENYIKILVNCID